MPPPYLYSSQWLLQTLLVALLLLGTCKDVVSSRYIEEERLDRQSENHINLTELKNKQFAAAASDDWRVCGKLELPSQHSIYAATGSAQRVVQRSNGVEIVISPETGTVLCRCRRHELEVSAPPNVDTTAQPAAFEVRIADNNNGNHFTVRLLLEASCRSSHCQRNPSILLKISEQQTKRYSSLRLSPGCDKLIQHKNSQLHTSLQVLDDGAVALSIAAVSEDGVKSPQYPTTASEKKWTLNQSNVSVLQRQRNHRLSSQECQIDLTQSVTLSNETKDIDSMHTRGITFTESLPLDLASCISLWDEMSAHQPYKMDTGATTLLLSVKPWSSGQRSLSSNHDTPKVFSSHHAKPSTTIRTFNDIHEKGSTTVGASLTNRGSSKVREVRQTISSPPAFNDTFYMAFVRENSQTGTVVTGVRATGNAPIVFTMTPDSGFSEGLFMMNSSTGVVTTTGTIDREMIACHTFLIQATDAGKRSSIAQMTITVEDENDNIPTFERSYFNISVDEDTDRMSTILRFSVVDEDVGVNGMIDFLLINNTDNTFTVTESSSQVAITLNQQLDYESQRFFLLTISAHDRGSPTRSSSATLEVHVLDVADSLPQFNATSYSTELTEDAPPSTYLLTVHATSQDSAPLATLQYVKVSGDSGNHFSLDGNTGVITLTKSLDFESTQVHVLVVQAQSVANPLLHSQTNVQISVINVNDHSPIFTRDLYTIAVLETVGVSHLVISVDAPDLDEGEFGEVSYRFRESTEQVVLDTFMLDSESGQITTIASLDREEREQYSFIVVGIDGGAPPRSSTSRVSITVTDVNDEAPVFTQRQYSASISENLDAGRSVIQVLAEDSDSAVSVVNYYIQSGNINSAFAIDILDGLISTRVRLDREEQASYNLLVVANDGSNENSTRVIVTVLDLNDESPTFDLSLYNFPSVSEGVAVGSQVGLVQAPDLDEGSNGMVVYTSTNIDHNFMIDRESGAIVLMASLDYEETERYAFDVTATDRGQPPRSSTAKVQINVFDENDNPPMFEPHPSTLNIAENEPAGPVTTVTATDADSRQNAAIQYEIAGDSYARKAFGIRQNGEVYTVESLDREIISQYNLIIRAVDGGVVRQTATLSLTVNVDDVIDYPPVFSEVVYEVLITRVHSRGLPVVTVHARTLDLVQPQSIIYHITSGANPSLFSIDQTTGMIFAETRIDPIEHEGVYTLGIMAQHRHLSESVFAIIRVMVDDGIPRLRPITLYFSGYPTLIGPVNHLGVVEIQQPKEGQEYTFSLVYSDPRAQQHFFINPTTGYLSVSNGVSSGHYQLNVSASTSTGNGSTIVDVFVTILTNQTLESAVEATFGGVREASFASIQLDQFIQFLTETVPCSRSQVEIVGIQHSGRERDEMVSVAFAVRQPDMTSYIHRDSLLDVLKANSGAVQPSTLLAFGSDVCVDEPCTNLQRCRPIVDVQRSSPATPFRVIADTHHFHTFSDNFVCSCPSGYSREDLCSSEIDECDPSPCFFGAKCIDLVGDYRCECPAGTYDKNCSSICASPESCDPCDTNPCLYEGTCIRSQQDLVSYRCEGCPWGNEFSGQNCELTSLHFTSKHSSFVAFQTTYDTSRFDVNFRFATISPNGLLFYAGNLGSQQDYVAAELVIGQLRVGVSFGGVATVLMTESLWNLNDGQWRSVSIQLRNKVLMLEVSHCSRQSRFFQEACRLEARLDSEAGRTLDLSSLLYFGGLEPHVSHGNVLSTSYDGCLADVELGGHLLDFGQPLREHGTEIGCPPLEGACSKICRSDEECVGLWGGSVCNCETDNCVGGSSVQLSNGYIHLESSSTITLMSFILSFRTRSTDAVLAQFGSFDWLELKHGSIVYRRGYSSTNMFTPLTFEVLGAVSDGIWHKVRLELNSTHTKLSVDEGRSSASLPEGGVLRITTVTLGADNVSGNSSRFSGCLAGMVINSESLNLENALGESLLNQHYQVSTHMAGSGCGSGSPCSDAECPTNTQCEAGWRNFSCECTSPHRIHGNQCINPCSTNPCKNGGTCEVSPFGSAGFQCFCAEGYQLPTCDLVSGGCGLGFHAPPSCTERCLCDPEGVDPSRVCDASTGACLCREDLDVYSASGDLGCQSCDCHVIGSASSKCDRDTGQCECRENVIGRRCGQCEENYAGMDEHGCHAATSVYGRFSFLDLVYERELATTSSVSFKELSQRISTEIERELYSFTLPGRFEVSIQNFFNSSGQVMIGYTISNYLPRGSTHVPRPSYSTLASVVQSMVQSGWVGPLRTNSSSHVVPIVCSQVPELCSGCPNATTRDGIICRAPAACRGVDSDRDGVPDSCDNCPLNFNPSQNATVCELRAEEAVCAGNRTLGIVWSRTSVGMIDVKRCPLPLIGFASRTCQTGREWSEVDLLGCISVAGQQYLAQADSLDDGLSLSFSQLEEEAALLETFTNEQAHTTNLIGGDVQVAGRVLDRYLRQLRGHATSEVAAQDEVLNVLEDMVGISENLLSSTLSQGWVGVVEEAGFRAEEFLETLEYLSATALDVVWQDSSPREHLLISTRRLSPGSSDNEMIFADSLLLEDLSATVELPVATPTSSVAMAMFSNLGPALNSYTFNSNASEPLAVATPILSVQMFNEGSKVTTLAVPFNLTLPYKGRLFLPHLRSMAACGWWQTGDRSGWSTEGCVTLSANLSHVRCQCNHLTAFAAILPAAALLDPNLPPDGFTPHPFTYLVLSLVSILLLVTLFLLACLRHMQSLLNTTHKNFILAFLLTTIVFVVGIDRTEVGEVCSAFGVALVYLPLCCVSWMVANGIIIARFLLRSQPKEKFAITLYITGWALPALLSGIAIGTVAVLQPSGAFLTEFGHPYYCWISVQSIGALLAPVLLLILCYITAVLFSIAARVSLRKETRGGRNVSLAATTVRNSTSIALLKSCCILLLFLVTLGLGLVAVYLHDQPYGGYLQYPFALFYGASGVVIVLVLCGNKHFADSWKLQFKKQPEVVIVQTGPIYSEIRKPVAKRRSANQRNQQHNRQQQRGGYRNPNTSNRPRELSPIRRTPSVPPEAAAAQEEVFVDGMVELMSIASPPHHPPPSPKTIVNQVSNLAPHAHSSPLFQHNMIRQDHQNHVRATSERHISETHVQPSLLHIPETRPFSPLTYGSDSESHTSNLDDIDHVPQFPSRVQGVNDEIDGPAAQAVFSGGEKVDYSVVSHQAGNVVGLENEMRITSPTLTELYERARHSSQSASARSYEVARSSEMRSGSGDNSAPGSTVDGAQPTLLSKRESNGLAIASADPLWYANKGSCLGSEADPLPYETVVRSPTLRNSSCSIPVSPSPSDDRERRQLPPLPTSLTSPRHSDGSSSSKHSSLSRNSSHRQTPTSASPSHLGYPGLEYETQRKHSLPVEWSKKQGSSSSTRNPLYSTSAAVSATTHSRKKRHASFHSSKDDHPLPPLPPPAGPIHTSPLPPLPHPPLEAPRSAVPSLKKSSVVRADSDTTKHTHFAAHVQVHEHRVPDEATDRESPLRAAATVSPPSQQVNKTPPLTPVHGANGLKSSPPHLRPRGGLDERRSASCSNSPAQSRHKKKKRGLERNDSYHSDGPSAEQRRKNQMFRHSDGSKTVQSLV